MYMYMSDLRRWNHLNVSKPFSTVGSPHLDMGAKAFLLLQPLEKGNDKQMVTGISLNTKG